MTMMLQQPRLWMKSATPDRSIEGSRRPRDNVLLEGEELWKRNRDGEGEREREGEGEGVVRPWLFVRQCEREERSPALVLRRMWGTRSVRALTEKGAKKLPKPGGTGKQRATVPEARAVAALAETERYPCPYLLRFAQHFCTPVRGNNDMDGSKTEELLDPAGR